VLGARVIPSLRAIINHNTGDSNNPNTEGNNNQNTEGKNNLITEGNYQRK
jgi:hypothetical protein